MTDNQNKMSPPIDSDGSDEGDWLDVEPDEEVVSIVSLFDAQTFPTLAAMLSHCKDNHGFDLTATIRRLQLDFHGAVKLVNYVRTLVKEEQDLPKDISRSDFEDDRFLQPVIENDALLFTLDEILEEDEADDKATEPATGNEDSSQSLSARNRNLEAELEALRSQFANYRLAVEQTLDRRWGVDDEEPAAPAPSAPKKDHRDYYFESYAEHVSMKDIHETMLKDTVRTDAYRDFIYENKELFKGKVVLDIGCGTGILSMFCAKAGAARVIAVDKSDIIEKARENISNNGLADTITCLKGAMEDVVLPVPEVDIIVSEWMGYCLLYEAMLPSVLYARDKYLKKDGLLVPSSGTIWIAPVADPEYISDHITFWRDVYGFDMKAMQEGIYDEVRVQTTPGSSVCGEPYPFRVLDLRTVRTEDLSFTAEWKSSLTRKIDGLDGFLIWFDNFFATSATEPVPEPSTTPEEWVRKKPGNVAFTTGPFGKETHWRQGLLLAPPDDSAADLGFPSELSGLVTFSVLEENERALMIGTTWSVNGQQRTRRWKLK
ncbi:Ribosomal protein arginine N-methyltransferase rmt3 [Paramyrothecium foliicola]|nr:Ribosomal protein arginine N-methyltransferase rmt3 [Paramyrothecium foliicola]